MANIFDEIITKGVRAGQVPARTKQARDWYREQAGSFRRINENKFFKSDSSRLTKKPIIGSMYMYFYDAKHKDTLPYYDRFPLVFPFAEAKGGFLGLNLHYLPLDQRAILMNALYGVTSNNRYDESTKMKLNYDTLKSASKFKLFKPCVKHYLTSQVQTQFMYIYPSEWDIALFLPTERFQGARKTTVFKDSRKQILGR
jgi:hypothetical protein